MPISPVARLGCEFLEQAERLSWPSIGLKGSAGGSDWAPTRPSAWPMPGTAALKLVAEVASGQDPIRKRKSTRRFQELADLYIDRYAKVHKRPKSIYEDERILRVDLLPAWGDRRLGEIQRADVIELLDEIAHGRGSPVMANRVRSLASKIFNFGIGRDLLPYNPCLGVPPPGKEKGRERVLSDEEITALWKALDNWPNQAKNVQPTLAVNKVILLTAQRPGEVKAMRWSDLSEDLWTISADRTKNGREHRVPVSAQALQVIEALREITGDSEWVFRSRLGGPLYWLQRVNAQLQKATGFHFTSHDLRRTAATNMSKLGVDDTLIARILNHTWADRNVTSVYNRWSKLPEMRRALEMWGSRLERIIHGRVQPLYVCGELVLTGSFLT